MGMAKEQAQLQNRANLRQYNYDMKQFEAQRADLERETELTNKVQDATFEYQQELRNIERLSILDRYEKSQDQYKQQLVWNDQAARSAVEAQNRVFEERMGSIQEDYENQQLQMRRQNIQSQYNLDQAEFTLEQALYNADQQKSSAELQYKQQQLAIGAERSNNEKANDMLEIQRIAADNKERDAVADRNFEQLAADVSLIEAQGQELARGRTGKSASNALQSNMAAFAFNTAKISDALYRSKESIKLERKQIRKEQRALNREEKLTNKQERLNKRNLNLNINQTKKSKKFAKKSARLDVNKLSKELGIDIEVFNTNKEKLGQSLLNAAASRDYAMEEIARGKAQADIQADAARMLPPRFAPDPPRPYKAEMPTLIPPPQPVQVTREAYQVPQPKKQSGMSKVLSIGGAILGIAGAAFTGGASLFATGGALSLGLASSTVSAIGVGATAASQGLGLISKYTY